MRYTLNVQPPPDRAVYSVAHNLAFALARRGQTIVCDPDPEGRPLVGGSVPHPRTVIHLAAPGRVMYPEGKHNILVSLRNQAGPLTLREVAAFRQAAAVFVFSEDQAHQVKVVAEVDAEVLQAAPSSRFSDLDPTRSRIRSTSDSVRFVWFGTQDVDEWRLIAQAWRDAHPPGLLHRSTLTVYGGAYGTPEAQGVRDVGNGVTAHLRNLYTDEEVAEVLPLYDVFVALSTGGAGLGVAALEAQAAGLLLVAPRLGTLAAASSLGSYVLGQPEDLVRAFRELERAWGGSNVEALREDACRKARALTWDAVAGRVVEVAAARFRGGLRMVG